MGRPCSNVEPEARVYVLSGGGIDCWEPEVIGEVHCHPSRSLARNSLSTPATAGADVTSEWHASSLEI
jgi:hypothetical protein